MAYDNDGDAARSELAVVLPSEEDVSREAAEQLLLSLSTCPSPVSFEVIGTSETISVQFSCRETEAVPMAEQITAYFPEAVVDQRKDFLVQAWQQAAWHDRLVVDFGLSNEFMRPVRTIRNFSVDPLIAIAAVLSGVRSDEVAVLQVLFRSCRHSWADSIMRAVTDGTGGSFFADAPEMVALAKEKISRPLSAVVIRAAAKSATPGRAKTLVRGLAGALGQLAEPSSNELIPLTNDLYDDEEHERDLLNRSSRRSGMILNTEELVSLVHPPSASVRLAKLERERRKTKAAPSTIVGHELVLGENLHAGKTATVSLNAEHRSRHTYVIGASGTGKSTLLLNMIVQDMRNGQGVGVLDPHGDLIDQVLGYVPTDRVKDVVLLDPSDAEFPLGFNILSAHSELEKNLLASDLAAVFRRLSTSWGDQMTAVLGNAVLAMLESDRGGTLIDLRRFLAEKDFRQEYLRSVRDPETVYYFEKEFSLLRGNPQASILTRLNTFLRPKPIRLMVAQKENRLDFAQIMNDGKIFLAKLAQGLIGEENSYLLGALLVTKFHQLAMGRQELVASARRNFWLYIDEFHHFVTPSLASLLSGARKYRLGLILAHQELRQLWDQDTAVASAVVTNPATRICFRVGDFDAKKLAEGFSYFDQRDLQSLGTGEAVCRVERAEYDFNLKTAPSPAIDTAVADMRREEIVQWSRTKYARPRMDVEGILAAARTQPQVAKETRRPTKATIVESAGVEQGTNLEQLPKHGAPPVIEEKRAMRSAEKKRPDLALVPPPLPLGQGGREHKYLQQLMKRLAEDRGYRAVVEQSILEGAGKVDVSLEKGKRRIACEISVTTSDEHEMENIQKCLAAGYQVVVAISSDAKVVRKLKATAESTLQASTLERVRFLQPDGFIAYLDESAAAEATREETVRGYRVRVEYHSLPEADAKTRKQVISQVLMQGTKRMKGKQ